MINKAVYLETIMGERFICIILEEDKDKYYYKSEFGEGYIWKDEVKEIDVLSTIKDSDD